jgi:hypothetical protein
VRYVYATRIRCDACGVEAEVKLDSAMTLPADPPGWTHAVVAVDYRQASQACDLCPDCAGEPFATIVEKLASK